MLHSHHLQKPQIPYLQNLKPHQTTKSSQPYPHDKNPKQRTKSTHNKSKTPSIKNAFILLDFVLAIWILSLIVIVLSQSTLYFQRHSLSKSTKQLKNLEANNAIDIVRNLVEIEPSIDFSHDTLRLPNHTIRLDSNNLLLDDSPILRNVSRFFITTTNNDSFSILLCVFENANKQSCINRAGFLSKPANNINSTNQNPTSNQKTSNPILPPTNITQNLAN